MKRPAIADLQRWSEEVARDPGSLAFLPLARAYRRQGRADAALRLCLRGMERHPESIDAHALLALLYLEKGDRARAADEWSMILRLDPGNFDALRGLGFCYLEDGAVERAHEHLQRAAVMRPDDVAVREALRLASERSGTTPAPAEPAALMDDEPWMMTPAPYGMEAEGEAEGVGSGSGSEMGGGVGGAPPAAAAAAASPAPVASAAPSPAVAAPVVASGVTPTDAAQARDPLQLFTPVVGGPVLGALLLDERGLVLAGALGEVGGNAEALAATLNGAIDEAARTASLLALGEWRGLLLETPVALLHITRAGTAGLVLIVARPDAPTGWILRSAAQAAGIAERFMEAYA